MDNGFAARVTRVADTVYVVMHGELGSEAVGQLALTVDPLMDRGVEVLVLNAIHLTYVDTVGLAEVVRIRREAKRKNMLVLLCVQQNSQVAHVVDVTGLGQIMRVVHMPPQSQ